MRAAGTIQCNVEAANLLFRMMVFSERFLPASWYLVSPAARSLLSIRIVYVALLVLTCEPVNAGQAYRVVTVDPYPGMVDIDLDDIDNHLTGVDRSATGSADDEPLICRDQPHLRNTRICLRDVTDLAPNHPSSPSATGVTSETQPDAFADIDADTATRLKSDIGFRLVDCHRAVERNPEVQSRSTMSRPDQDPPERHDPSGLIEEPGTGEESVELPPVGVNGTT